MARSKDISHLGIQVQSALRTVRTAMEADEPISADPTVAYATLSEMLGQPADLSQRTIAIPGGEPCLLVFLQTLTDQKLLSAAVVRPLTRGRPPQSQTQRPLANYSRAVAAILKGEVVVLGSAAPYSLNTFKWPARPPKEPTNEAVVHGPHLGFVENWEFNVAMVRTLLRNEQLRVDNEVVHAAFDMNVYILYIEGRVQHEVITAIKSKLASSETTIPMTDTTILVEYLTPAKPLALMQTTERPDRVVAALSEGRCAVMLEGSPTVALAPTVFLHLMQPADDYYVRPVMAMAKRALRTLGLMLTLTLSAFFVAMATINIELIPAPLMVSLGQTRQSVPFPVLVEVLLMEGAIELVREAGIRMPGSLGQTVSILGAVVVGQSAVQAGIFSAPVVVVAALGFLASFTVAHYSASLTFRLARFFLIGVGAILGVTGVSLGVYVMLFYIASLDSFGVPYLTPLAPFARSKLKDAFVRLIPRRRHAAKPWPLRQGPTP